MLRKRPFFSIITSFFNSEKYIFKYITRLQDQTFLNWECILIDDYSEDNFYEKVYQLIKNDERIKLYKNILKKEMHGPYQGRNYGLNLASGEYICFLDIDDYWHKKMLEIKYNYLIKNKKIDIISTNYFRCKKSLKIKFSNILEYENIDISEKVKTIKSPLNYDDLLFID